MTDLKALMNSNCCDSFFVGKLTSRALTPCKNIIKIPTKRLEKIKLKIGQKYSCNWGHARACDTVVCVPVVMTTANPWCGLSVPLFLDFWGASLDPPWLG